MSNDIDKSSIGYGLKRISAAILSVGLIAVTAWLEINGKSEVARWLWFFFVLAFFFN
ncbi:hypothetical protein [Methylobacter sp.]